jgi:hypothetical protein
MEFKRVYDRTQIWVALHTIYSGDTDFVQNLHKTKSKSAYGAANDSLNNISTDTEFYLAYSGRQVAGFFAINKTYPIMMYVIEGFHVIPECRDAKFLSQYWADAKLLMEGKPTGVCIYSKNETAIKHLKKNGFEDIREMVHDGISHVLLIHS